MATNYETATLDVYYIESDSNMPDPSGTAGNAYPPDFYNTMPGFVVPTIQHNSDGLKGPRGDWSTPQAYSWHSSIELTTDPEIGGAPGRQQGAPFAFGGVESSTVENFEMLGNQAIFQAPSVMNWGDVGFSDTAGVLGASLASQSFTALPFESWSASVVAGY